MAKLGMGISRKSFRIVNHALNGLVWPASCCMVNVNTLKLDVKRTYVFSIEPNYVLSYHLYF